MLYTVTLAFDNVERAFRIDVPAKDSKWALKLAEQDARSTRQGMHLGELVASIVTELEGY